MVRLIPCLPSLIMVCCWVWNASGQVPAPSPKPVRGFILTNVHIHNGLGQSWDGGFVQVENGKITDIGEKRANALSESEKARFDLVDGKGQHLYPGFILLNSPLGLNEIDAVRATVDHTETGDENPNAHTLSAYNTDSDIIPTLRLNGILTAQIAPRGNRIRGMSAVVQLDAWNWEDAVIRERDALHLVWPSKYARQGWWAEPGGMEASAQAPAQIRELERTFEEARMYSRATEKKRNTRLEALIPVLSGKQRLFLHAEFAADIVSGLEFCRSQGIEKVVLVSGSQALEVVDLLKSRNIPLVYSRVHQLPVRNEDPVQWPVEAAVRLRNQGITVALDYEGDMEIMGSRNLGFLAGSTTRFGLTMEQALELITRNPARILGLDSQLGTLERGRDATFFLSAGNALDMKTQQLTRAWIQGRPIVLESKQTELYRKFNQKPE